MFYISDIKGNLTPLQQIQLQQPLPITSGNVNEVAAVEPSSPVVVSASAQAVAAETSTDTSAISAAAVVPAEQDAAVFDGSVVQIEPPYTDSSATPAAAPTDTSIAASTLAHRPMDRLRGETQNQETEDMTRHVDRIAPSARVTTSTKRRPQNQFSNEGGGQYHLKGHYAPTETPERKPALLAHQIMSSPVFTLPAETTLTDAQQAFHKHRFRHVPVVSKEGRLIGIISDRDFIPKPSAIDVHAKAQEIKTEQTIQSIMTTNILTARPETEIRQIAAVMFEHHISALPILDIDGQLVGIVTRSDILHAIVNHAPLELWT